MTEKLSILIVTLVLFCGASVFGALEDVTTQSSNGEDEETSLTAADFEKAKNLTESELYEPAGKVNLGQQDKWHGDLIETNQTEPINRNGVISSSRIWPNGRIPYSLSSVFSSTERAVIARAVAAFPQKTGCIEFVPRQSTESSYVYFTKDDGCYSYVGRIGRRQEISLSRGCVSYDTAIHEMMHAAGFYHEHERYDRDSYVQVLTQNIKEGSEDQFEKIGPNRASYYGQAYDYLSVMHYSRKAFSKNGQDTMVATKDPSMTSVMGNVQDFSNGDVARLKSMYNCGQAPAQCPSGQNQVGTCPSGACTTAGAVCTQGLCCVTPTSCGCKNGPAQWKYPTGWYNTACAFCAKPEPKPKPESERKPTPEPQPKPTIPSAAQCPTGQTTVGTCANGQACSSGATCNQGLCCQAQVTQCASGQTLVGYCTGGKACPSSTTCYQNTLCCQAPATCPSGQTQVGNCFLGRCPTGSTCVQNRICCRAPVTCADQSPYCYQYTSYCTSTAQFGQAIRTYCPRSCNQC